MAGFLDPEQRVIDMVLTDTGKQLLMKGQLRFVYWIPYDDEVDYNPPTYVEPGSTMSLPEISQIMTETPLVREATLGYRGLNFVAMDTTNVHRPMYSVPPGVGVAGHPFPLPQMSVDQAALAISMSQQPLKVTYIKKDSGGQIIQQIGPIDNGVQRFGSDKAQLAASFPSGAFPSDFKSEGFLATVHLSSAISFQEGVDPLAQAVLSGGYEEILHNRDSVGDISYRNDLKLEVLTP